MQESELAKRYKGDREFFFKREEHAKRSVRANRNRGFAKDRERYDKVTEREKKKENITRIMKMKYQK